MASSKVKNALAKKASKENNNEISSVKGLLSLDAYKKRFEEVLGKRAPQFMSSLISAVNSNADLANCQPQTVIHSALKAAVLDLPIESNFGFAHLVPYMNNKKGYKECQFQMGWKGYVQLALRTGMYKNINVVDVRENELKKWDPLTEELEIEFIEDDGEREKTKIIGYAGYFGLINGFEKKTYWPLKKLLSHAKQYSAQYRKYGTGNWKENQDAMCRKTVAKNMLNKWGILSVEMQSTSRQLLDAMEADQAVIREDETYDHIDSSEVEADYTVEDSDEKENEGDQVDLTGTPFENK